MRYRSGNKFEIKEQQLAANQREESINECWVNLILLEEPENKNWTLQVDEFGVRLQ